MSDFLSNNSSNLAIFTMFYGSSLDMLAHEECVPNSRSESFSFGCGVM